MSNFDLQSSRTSRITLVEPKKDQGPPEKEKGEIAGFSVETARQSRGARTTDTPKRSHSDGVRRTRIRSTTNESQTQIKLSGHSKKRGEKPTGEEREIRSASSGVQDTSWSSPGELENWLPMSESLSWLPELNRGNRPTREAQSCENITLLYAEKAGKEPSRNKMRRFEQNANELCGQFARNEALRELSFLMDKYPDRNLGEIIFTEYPEHKAIAFSEYPKLVAARETVLGFDTKCRSNARLSWLVDFYAKRATGVATKEELEKYKSREKDPEDEKEAKEIAKEKAEARNYSDSAMEGLAHKARTAGDLKDKKYRKLAAHANQAAGAPKMGEKISDTIRSIKLDHHREKFCMLPFGDLFSGGRNQTPETTARVAAHFGNAAFDVRLGDLRKALDGWLDIADRGKVDTVRTEFWVPATNGFVPMLKSMNGEVHNYEGTLFPGSIVLSDADNSIDCAGMPAEDIVKSLEKLAGPSAAKVIFRILSRPVASDMAKMWFQKDSSFRGFKLGPGKDDISSETRQTVSKEDDFFIIGLSSTYQFDRIETRAAAHPIHVIHIGRSDGVANNNTDGYLTATVNAAIYISRHKAEKNVFKCDEGKSFLSVAYSGEFAMPERTELAKLESAESIKETKEPEDA